MTTTIRIHPGGLLSRIANSNSSGCLELDEGLVSWKIYLQHGNLKYAYCSAQLLDQLKYYLHYLGWKQALVALKSPAYLELQFQIQEQSSRQHLYCQVISWLLAEKHLDSYQGLKLIEYMTQDALQSCLWLNRGTYSWHNREPIPLWIRKYFGDSLYPNLSECLNTELNRVKKWQSCSSKLLSVHQRPYLASGWQQKTLPISGPLSYVALEKLAQVMRGATSIRQLSLWLQKDELQVAQILSPYIDHQIICLRNAQPPLDLLPSIPRTSRNNQHSAPGVHSSKRKKTIVCIDDSPIILNALQRFIDQEKFKVTVVNDPVEAVPIIFRLKPDLILLDITMPKINGYKLCTLLRASEHCMETPIIMVTGNTGFIDKARAKIAGATDYFTKPFTKQGLIKIIEKYLN